MERGFQLSSRIVDRSRKEQRCASGLFVACGLTQLEGRFRLFESFAILASSAPPPPSDLSRVGFGDHVPRHVQESSRLLEISDSLVRTTIEMRLTHRVQS